MLDHVYSTLTFSNNLNFTPHISNKCALTQQQVDLQPVQKAPTTANVHVQKLAMRSRLLCKSAKKKKEEPTYENNLSVWSGHLFTGEAISSG